VVTTIELTPGGARAAAPRRYFELSLQPGGGGEADLAAELAGALRNAVRRRTLPRLGRTAVALSGGLDSRTILACVENKDLTFAFSCYNQPNREFEVAQAIAGALEVPFKPWQRPLSTTATPPSWASGFPAVWARSPTTISWASWIACAPKGRRTC